jgi:hypothetical protein
LVFKEKHKKKPAGTTKVHCWQLEWPGSILIRSWVPQFLLKFIIRNNPVQFTQKISFLFALQGETQEKTCGNDESALVAAGMGRSTIQTKLKIFDLQYVH